jgi:hypothetical protein
MSGRAIRRGLMRQGDVLLIPVDADVGSNGEAPKERHAQVRLDGRLVLAEGEATGHAHAILDEHARLEVQHFGESRAVWIHRRVWTESRTLLVVEDEPATLVHEEHEPLTVPPGSYVVRRQREYAPVAGVGKRGWRWVAD